MAEEKAYPMFSLEHIQALVALVGDDPAFLQKAQAEDLTVQVVIKMEGTDKIYKLNMDKGKLTKLEFDEDAPFILSASKETWEAVFLGTLNPLVAIGQGKIKLVKGQMMQLARWFGSFNRMFELFKEIKIERA